MNKGLEALEELKFFIPNTRQEQVDLVEKELKALEIIKNNCDIDTLIGVFSKTEEEYDLLKEVLL